MLRRLLFAVLLLAAWPLHAAELTWTTLPNVAMSTADAATAQKNTLWALAASLAGNTSAGYWDGTPAPPGSGFWSHCGSGDGGGNVTTPAADCSGTDRWSASASGTFNVSKIVAAAEGVAHSWYVLRSPGNFGGLGGGVYFYFTVNVVSATAPTIWLAKTLPTGGTNTARPTSTDEVQLNTVGLDATWASSSQYRIHLSTATAGDWWFLTSRDTAANFYQVIGVTALKDTKSGDLFPVVGASSSNYWTCLSWDFAKVLCSGTTTTVKGRSRLNAANVNYTVVPSLYIQSTSSFCDLLGHVQSPDGSACALSYKLPGSSLAGADAEDSRYVDFPMYMVANTVGYVSLRGRFADLRWAPTLSNLTVAPSTPNYTAVVYGTAYGAKTWFPWVTSEVPTP